MIRGLDIGYCYTKDHTGVMFKTAYTEDYKFASNCHELILDNKTYYIGIGNGTVEINKANTTLNRICMLTALALDTADEYFIVTGLPISQFKSQKEELRNQMLRDRRNRLVLNGKERTFNIIDVMVYPQAVGAIYSENLPEEDVIVVDFGGRTVDIAYFEIENNKINLVKNDTLFNGTIILYTKIVDAINKKFDLTLETKAAEKILTKGLELYGVKQDLSFLKSILSEHIQPIIDQLILNYPSQTTRILLCGGGSIILGNIFIKRFPNAILMKNPQFANAKGFRRVGEAKWRT
jgi:plasmid segregation protein ParM